MRKVPELRFDGFDGEWEEKKFSENFDTTIPKNSLSRDKLTDQATKVKNIHYGDIHKIFDNVLQTSNEKIPHIINDDLSTHERYFLRDGDIIFTDAAEDNTAGKCVELDFDDGSNIVAGLHTIPARPIEFGKYFYGFYLNSNSFHNKIIPLLEGTKVSSISKTNLNTLSVIVPKIQEQEKIGDLFKKIDALIEIQEGKVSKMRDYKKSMLQKMFPKKDELVPEFRFDGFDNYGFDKGKINDFIVTHGSKNYIKQPADVGTYKVIQQGDIPIAGYSNEEPYKDFSNVILFGDHTLSLFKPYEPFLLSTDGIKIIYIENIDREYFYYLVQHVMPKSQGYKRHYKILRAVKVNIPKSYKEQQKIGQFFKNLDTQIENEEKLLDSYKMMKKSLLQKMFV